MKISEGRKLPERWSKVKTGIEKIDARMPKKPKIKSVAYSQGIAAFLGGKTSTENPYSSGKSDRKEWFDGYFDTRLDATVERVRTNLGLDNRG